MFLVVKRVYGANKNTNRRHTDIKSKQKVTVSISVTHDLKFKPDLSMMKAKVEKYDSLVSKLTRG